MCFFSSVVRLSNELVLYALSMYPDEPPNVGEVPDFLKEPLPDKLKLPFPNDLLDRLIICPLIAAEAHKVPACTREDIEAVFRRSTANLNMGLLNRIMNFVWEEVPPVGGREASFVHFWDTFIRRILQLFFPSARIVRDSTIGSGCGYARPDFALIIGTDCVLRGEEKRPSSSADVQKELRSKTVWIYDPAPYILGWFFLCGSSGLRSSLGNSLP